MKKKHFALLLFLVSYISIYGQSFSTEGWWSPETQKYSPVVTADGQITFRTFAPNCYGFLVAQRIHAGKDIRSSAAY